MRHPPFATGIAHMDRYGLRDIAAFAEIVSRNRQIERILCGHLHRAIDRRFAGTVAGTAPVRMVERTRTRLLVFVRAFRPPSIIESMIGPERRTW
jgi:3',5'-cyclic AMP phosphodiesterase CpdA